MVESNITILMATYNGAKFLKQQVDSIINQTYKNWTLYICDDGSSDDTLDIIKNYIKEDQRIKLYKKKYIKRGAKFSFIDMMENIDSDYYMFSDQDDVWLPSKIKECYDEIKGVEIKNNNKNIPIIVFTDLIVVDKNLQLIHNSFWESSKIFPSILNNINYLGICNCVTGCTMLFNKYVKDYSLPMPENAEMHDWWIALNTIKKGILQPLNKGLIYYRQHSSNTVGATKVDTKYYRQKVAKLKTTFDSHLSHYKFLKNIKWGSWFKFYKYKVLYQIKRNQHAQKFNSKF